MAALVNVLEYLLVGLAAGTVSGLLGIGGGILMVPLIVLIWKMDMKIAIGTSLAVMIPLALAGGMKHFTLGHVNLTIAAGLAVGAIIGTVFIGAPLANYLPSDVLKRIFGVLMIVSGLQWSGVLGMISRVFGNGPGG